MHRHNDWQNNSVSTERLGRHRAALWRGDLYTVICFNLFKAVDPIGDGQFWRTIDPQMHLIALAVYFDKFSIELSAHTGKVAAELGWMRFRCSRKIIGAVKKVTANLSGGKWVVSIQTENAGAKAGHSLTSIVGRHAGVAKLATGQRKLSGKIKFNSNWRKQKRKIQHWHSRIVNIR